MARKAAEGTRERILEAAAELFYARGVRAVGMSQIIDAAGCGKNLLYRHFPSKGDLVAAYLDAEAQYREQQARDVLSAAGGDPADQIVALTRYLRDHPVPPRDHHQPPQESSCGRLAGHVMRAARHNRVGASRLRSIVANVTSLNSPEAQYLRRRNHGNE